MELKEYIGNVMKGVVGALAVTLILTTILTMTMTFKTLNDDTINTIFVIITSIALIFGTILAARLHDRKGWLVGLAVGILFYISLYVIGILFGAEADLNLNVFLKFVLCILLGLLSGMLGINLKKE